MILCGESKQSWFQNWTECDNILLLHISKSVVVLLFSVFSVKQGSAIYNINGSDPPYSVADYTYKEHITHATHSCANYCNTYTRLTLPRDIHRSCHVGVGSNCSFFNKAFNKPSLCSGGCDDFNAKKYLGTLLKYF